jgi:ArsR family transcriptional regulator
MIKPESLFNILSDLTRLRALMLIQSEGEACVCELTFALNESQPKISRHLALMRDSGIVRSRREGTWMHYRIEPTLPEWAREVIVQTHDLLNGLAPYRKDRQQLARMDNRPERRCA